MNAPASLFLLKCKFIGLFFPLIPTQPAPAGQPVLTSPALTEQLLPVLDGGHVLVEGGQQLVRAADVGQPRLLVLAAAAAALALPLPGAGPRGGRAPGRGGPGLGPALAADPVRQLGVRGEGLGAGPLGVGALRGVEVGVAAGVARPVRAGGRGAAAGLGAVREAWAEMLL